MAHAGQELHGPGGFRLRLVKTAAETDGEVLEMEAIYAGTGQFFASGALADLLEEFSEEVHMTGS